MRGVLRRRKVELPLARTVCERESLPACSPASKGWLDRILSVLVTEKELFSRSFSHRQSRYREAANVALYLLKLFSRIPIWLGPDKCPHPPLRCRPVGNFGLCGWLRKSAAGCAPADAAASGRSQLRRRRFRRLEVSSAGRFRQLAVFVGWPAVSPAAQPARTQRSTVGPCWSHRCSSVHNHSFPPAVKLKSFEKSR